MYHRNAPMGHKRSAEERLTRKANVSRKSAFKGHFLCNEHSFRLPKPHRQRYRTHSAVEKRLVACQHGKCEKQALNVAIKTTENR